MKKNLITRISLTVLFLAMCLFFYKEQNYKDFDKIINNYVNENCNLQKKCIIDLKKIYKFEWDSFYFFETGATLSDKKFVDMFGKVNNGLADRHILFIFKNKVVFSQRIYTNIEKIDNATVWFDFSENSDKFIRIDSDKSTLNVENKAYEEGYYLQLSDVRR